VRAHLVALVAACGCAASVGGAEQRSGWTHEPSWSELRDEDEVQEESWPSLGSSCSPTSSSTSCRAQLSTAAAASTPTDARPTSSPASSPPPRPLRLLASSPGSPMFGSRRPAPKAPGASPTTARPPHASGTSTLAVPASAVAPSSPLSSLPPTSPRSPAISATTTTTTTTTAVKKPVATVTRTITVARTLVKRAPPPPADTKPVARTHNAYKRPADAPPLAAAPAAKRAVKGGANGAASNGGGRKGRVKIEPSSDDDDAAPRSARKGAGSAGRRPQPPSSDLDPLTPSEASESDLSSVDEDYFSKTLAKEEGAPVCARDVAAKGEGSTEGKSGESLVLENRTAYKDRASLSSSHPPPAVPSSVPLSRSSALARRLYRPAAP